jgi:hypothetical protein
LTEPLRLVGIDAELHIGQSERQRHPVRFRLVFQSSPNLTLSISGSGDGLVLDDRLLFAVDMAEYGKTIVQDVVRLIAPRMCNASISSVTELRAYGKRAGLTLSAETSVFHIWVDSDEWFWGNDLDLQQHCTLNAWPITVGANITQNICR